MAVEELDLISRYGLEVGTPKPAAIGSLAVGPDGIIFLADNRTATIFAVALGQSAAAASSAAPQVDRLETRLAALLGCSREDAHVQDIAVSGSAIYLSVMRGSGDAATPVLIRVGAGGSLEEVSLTEVPFASVAISDAPAPDDARTDVRVLPPGEPADEEAEYHGVHLRLSKQGLRTATVTDLAYADGALLVAGASNEEFSSTLRRIPFPFKGSTATTSLEIYHVSHGRYETASPIRTFAPIGELGILASYTCTPLVRFSLSDLQPGSVAKGTTVAELGHMNTPLDLVSFGSGGHECVLVSNSRHPLLKFDTEDLARQGGLTTPREPIGAARQEMPQKGVTRMANWNGSYVLMLQRDEAGDLNLRAYSTDSL